MLYFSYGLALFLCVQINFFPIALYANIYTISSIKSVKNHLKKESYVIFDLDLTLLAPEKMMGHPEWFNDRVKHYKEKGHVLHKAVESSVIEIQGIYNLVQF